MPTIQIYTFKNCPYKKSLPGNFFEFEKLKDDFVRFAEIVETKQPGLILGVAKSSLKESKFETRTVNVFNKTKKVNQKGKEEFSLDYPTNGFRSISLNESYTDSFCNWTMYKIAEYIDHSKTKLQFIHIDEKDLGDLREYFSKIK